MVHPESRSGPGGLQRQEPQSNGTMVQPRAALTFKGRETKQWDDFITQVSVLKLLNLVYLGIFLSLFFFGYHPKMVNFASLGGLVLMSVRTQSCLTLGGPKNCSSPGSSVHGIFQARILDWVAISYTRGFSQPRDWTCISCVSCIGRWILYHSPPQKPLVLMVIAIFWSHSTITPIDQSRMGHC